MESKRPPGGNPGGRGSELINGPDTRIINSPRSENPAENSEAGVIALVDELLRSVFEPIPLLCRYRDGDLIESGFVLIEIVAGRRGPYPRSKLPAAVARRMRARAACVESTVHRERANGPERTASAERAVPIERTETQERAVNRERTVTIERFAAAEGGMSDEEH